MNDFRADLHCHSTCSDGTLTPTEIIKLAHEIGLQGLSITDHDTINAYNDANKIAKNYNIDLISGAEFSAVHNDVSVHILGYSFELQNKLIQTLCLKHKNRRESRNQAILDKLSDHKMPLDMNEIKALAQGTIGRPHIAQAMVNHGYVDSIQDAFKKYIGGGKPCFAKTGHIDVTETIQTIHEAGGFAIIAHPHLIQNQKTLTDLLKMNFDGLECHYAKFAPSKEKRWVKIAKHRGWLMTGGSDFHGEVKPHIPLGCSWATKDTFDFLNERHIKNNQ